MRRNAEIVVEAALRTRQLASGRPVDRVAWAEIAAAADAYLSATTRSEHVHHQVRPTALQISSSYEIEITYDPTPDTAEAPAGAGKVYDLDVNAMRRARATLHLGDHAGVDPVESAETALPLESETQGSPTSMVAPELDMALHDAFGVSGTDLLTTLFALARWPLTEDDDDVVAASVDAVVEHVLNFTILGEAADGRTHVENAVTLLSSTSRGLVTAEWKPWHLRSRRRRLLIQPLPTLSDGRVVVAPHFCLASMSAYQSHLSQGQLPWTQPAPDEPPLPAAVTAALATVRDKRNKELERTVAIDLRRQNWRVIENIKKTDPSRLGVSTLSGEIDIVTGSSGRRTLWLLEVKDPADTYVVPEIRRHLDTFFADREKKLSYTTRLQQKFDDLAPHVNGVASALGLPTREDGYELVPAFVTRHPVAAEFVTGPFKFASLRELSTLLEAHEPYVDQ